MITWLDLINFTFVIFDVNLVAGSAATSKLQSPRFGSVLGLLSVFHMVFLGVFGSPLGFLPKPAQWMDWRL